MDVGQSIKSSSPSLQLTSNLKEEIKHPNTETIEIKKEYDLIDGFAFESVITIENDPMESILNQKPKLRKKKYTCHNCSKLFFSKSMLKCHMEMHTGRKIDNENCPLQFTSTSNEETKKPNTQPIEIKKETDLIKNCDILQLSNLKQPLKCEGVCKTSFRRKSTTFEHKKTQTDEKLFKCNFCEGSFTRLSSLKRHKFTHTKEKPFKCNVCEISFTVLSSLKRHNNYRHTEEKKQFKCNVCEISFTTLSNLKRHNFLHTGEKPFKCEVCKTTFRRKSTMLEHTMIHTGEKPFKCNVCEVSFTRLFSLKRHKLIHTIEKPFKCNVCEISFTLLSSLKKHKLIHTG